MAVIAYITDGRAGSLNSALVLSARLRAAGHDVIFMSSEEISSRITSEGFSFVRLSADSMYREQYDAAQTRRERRAARDAALVGDEIERALVNARAEACLIDLEMHYAIIATARLGVPTLLTIVQFSVYRSLGTPPLNSHLRPPTNAIEKARVGLEWLKIWAAFAWRDAWTSFKRLVGRAELSAVRYRTMRLTDLRALARKKGFPLRKATSRMHWLRPHVYTEIQSLCFNIAELDFPDSDHSDLIHYVGPMINTSREETRMTEQERNDLDTFLEDRVGEAGRPLIYCSLGAFLPTDTGFMSRVVDVLRRRPDWTLILGLGAKGNVSALGDLPPNVLAMTWAPQLEILGRASCAVIHGGTTTINECILAGVPMVLYPHDYNDLQGNSARAAHAGLGVVGDKLTDDAASIEAAIQTVMSDRSFTDSVATYQHLARRYEESRAAERIVEQALARSTTTASY